MPPAIDKLFDLARSPEGAGQPVWLVQGDLVLAEPAAARLAVALAERAGCAVESHRRPADLLPLLADLRTYSLFGGGKVLLVTDSAALADQNAAAELLADAQEALPVDPARPLAARERQAASRLLQALRLFSIDPERGSAEEAIERLLAAVAAAGGEGKKRARKPAEELRGQLAALLAAARREGLQGWGESALAELVAVVQGGLPPGHTLVLAERMVAASHPLVRLLAERGALARVGEVEAGYRRGTWDGLDLLAAELAQQSGVGIEREALAELARRTLHRGSGWDRDDKAAEADSTARFAGEYRKLAQLAHGRGAARIDRALVASAVDDRGEEDVWQILDAMGDGRAGEALERLRRLLAVAEDPVATRLSFFTLLAGYCRRLVAVHGMMRLGKVPSGERDRGRFERQIAPALQRDLPGGRNPIASLKPYPLHRAYLAASRLPAPLLARLPAEVLETELQMKGESGEAEVALARLVAHVAGDHRRERRA
jgi:DNA polymerase III delta subunit